MKRLLSGFPGLLADLAVVYIIAVFNWNLAAAGRFRIRVTATDGMKSRGS